MQTYNKTVCGLDLTFNAAADADRVEKAIAVIQGSYDNLQFQGNQLAKDKLLAILAIGIADDLLQIQKEYNEILQVCERKEEKEKVMQARLEHVLQLLDSLGAVEPFDRRKES